jgi:kynurenine formamidase
MFSGVSVMERRCQQIVCWLHMSRWTVTMFGALTVAIAACQSAPPVVRWKHIVDLTHTLSERTPYIPIPGLTFPFKKTPIATLDAHGVAAYRWDIHEHIGTQIDAPSHFVAGGAGLEALPVESLVVPLVVIDISGRSRADADAAVTVQDILEWEKTRGRLPARAAVLMHSGWDAKIADNAAFVNQDAAGVLHFPGFTPEAASFLARERDVSGLGVDTLSLDPGVDKKYQAHRVWLATGRWAVELVANLAQVPPAGATLFVGASKVEGATGGPVRLIAVW